MSVYGNVPRAGDRVIWLTATHPDLEHNRLGVAINFTQAMPSRHRSNIRAEHLLLVEGVVTSQNSCNDLSRNEAPLTLGSVTLMFNDVNATRIMTATAYYGYHNVHSAVTHLRSSAAFSRFNDDQLRTLLTLCFPQVVGTSEYCKLIKDIRGDQELPASVRIDVSNAAALAESLGIRWVPFTMESQLHASVGYYSGDDAEQERVFIESINHDFRRGFFNSVGGNVLTEDYEDAAPSVMDIESGSQNNIFVWNTTPSVQPPTSTGDI